MKPLLGVIVSGIFAFAFTAPAHSEVACTLLLEVGRSEPVFQNGEQCGVEFAPASTFKIPLALIGFETGLLKSPDEPVIDYDPALNAPYKSWRRGTSPRDWLQYSVIWYSHWLTQQLGMEQFQGHVDALGYGNQDLSGTPGLGDGLTRAWLSTSLKISPQEQAEFLMRLISGDLPYSVEALSNTMATTTQFETQSGLVLHGKTGNAWATDALGNRLKEQHGWFVGWFPKNDTQFVFVHLLVGDVQGSGFLSSRARMQVLAELDDWFERN